MRIQIYQQTGIHLAVQFRACHSLVKCHLRHCGVIRASSTTETGFVYFRPSSVTMSHSEVAADVHEDKEHEEPDVAVQEKVSDGASLDSPVESARLLDCSRPRSSSEAGIPSAVLQGRIRSTSFNEQGTHSPLRMRQAPARRVLLAIDGSQGSKNAFDCKPMCWCVRLLSIIVLQLRFRLELSGRATSADN